MATLIIQSADATGPDRVMRVEGKIVYLGRSPKCTVQLNDPTVSRLQAALTRQGDGGWALVRHKSAQPVWVDGEAVDKRPLRGGERIRIGGFTILFYAHDASVAGVDDETVRGQPVVAVRAESPEAILRFEAGGPGIESVRLTRVITVFGRGEECDVVLDDQRCSRRHMEISRVDDAFVLRDLDSTNGVMVNGERVAGEVEMIPGDVVQVGGTRMRFEIDGHSQPEAMPTPAARVAAVGPPGLPDATSPGAAPPSTVPGSPGLVGRWVQGGPWLWGGIATFAAMLAAASVFVASLPSGREATPRPDAAAEPAGTAAQEGLASAARREEAGDAIIESAAPGAEPASAAASPSEGDAAGADEGDVGLLADAAAVKPGPADAERLFSDLLQAGESRGKHDEPSGDAEQDQDQAKPDEPQEAPEEDEKRSKEADVPRDSEGVAGSRLAVPDDADITAALANIREVYAEGLADSQPLEPTLSKLLAAARKTSKPASKYALLVAAEQRAVQAGDYRQAIDVIDVRARTFEVDALQGRLDMLRETSKAAEASDEIYDLTVNVAGDAIKAERYEVATKAAALAAHVAALLEQQSSAKAVRSPFGPSAAGTGRAASPAKPSASADQPQRTEAAKQLRQAVSECRKLHQKFEQARRSLEETPDDEKSLEVVGRYLCFVKEDWQQGLPSLAAGPEGALRSLAERELAMTADGGAAPEQVFALAGDWWALADAPRRASELPPGAAAVVKNHAATIYERILGKISDPIEAELAKKRIATAVGESPPWRIPPGGRGQP